MNRIVYVVMRWFLVLCYALMIITFPASAVVPQKALDVFGMDKVVHLAVYAVLCFLICRALTATAGQKLGRRLLFLAFTLTVLYGAFDEIQQIYVPSRCASPFDLIADALGALAIVLLWPKATSKWPILMR